jgi:hypothetical protein
MTSGCPTLFGAKLLQLPEKRFGVLLLAALVGTAAQQVIAYQKKQR